jgi:hypothetical protein
MPPDMPDMKQKIAEVLKNTSPMGTLMVLLFVIVFFILYYVYSVVKKRDYNCKVISSYPIKALEPLSNEVLNTTLNKTFIKTAYNCCCTGDFKNDYVDTCALMNCAKQGVRALDFTIYSLKGQPVIAASTLDSKKYKEMYNSLPLSKTMAQVKQMFMYDTANCSNVTDPLFLIFRIQSSNILIYNKIEDIVQSIFGYGNASGDKIYKGKNIERERISALQEKVIIFVDLTGLTNFESSNLALITALPFGTITNQIYRESDAYDLLDTGVNPNEDNVNILYPDFATKSSNYDFDTVGLKQNFNFIGMNFQMNDVYLDAYNGYFKSAIIKQPKNINPSL